MRKAHHVPASHVPSQAGVPLRPGDLLISACQLVLGWLLAAMSWYTVNACVYLEKSTLF